MLVASSRIFLFPTTRSSSQLPCAAYIHPPERRLIEMTMIQIYSKITLMSCRLMEYRLNWDSSIQCEYFTLQPFDISCLLSRLTPAPMANMQSVPTYLCPASALPNIASSICYILSIREQASFYLLSRSTHQNRFSLPLTKCCHDDFFVLPALTYLTPVVSRSTVSLRTPCTHLPRGLQVRSPI